MITPMLQFLGETKIHDQWLDRGEFSELVESVLKKAQIEHIPHTVTALDREPAGKGGFYKITVKDGYVFYNVYAREVVAGIGLGQHKPPAGPDGETPLASDKIAKANTDIAAGRRVMDMDVFTRVAGQLEKIGTMVRVGNRRDDHSDITLVLSGGNAGIDVAFDALRRGYKVKWIVGTRPPMFVPGFPNYGAYLAYLRSLTTREQRDVAGVGSSTTRTAIEREARKELRALYKNQDEAIFEDASKKFRTKAKFDRIYFGRAAAVNVTDTEVKVTVSEEIQGQKTEHEVKGDVMVFAQGQGTENFKLFEKLTADLVPEKDVNQRFGDEHTTIGLRSQDNTLKIVGANAYRLAAKIPDPVRSDHEMEEYEAALADAREKIRTLRSRPPGFWSELVVISLAYSLLRRSAQKVVESHLLSLPEQTVVESKLLGEIRAFAEACTRYETLNEELKKRPLPFDPDEVTEASKALKAFNEALTKARTNAQQRMKPVIDSLPDNVLINDQLTPSRSQIVVSTNFLPYDIARKANFVTDDRTALAVHISANYGKLADNLAKAKSKRPFSKINQFEELVDDIIESRTLQGPRGPRFVAIPPHGKAFQEYWENELQKRNNQAR
jgi:hypothetical protein